MARENGRIYKYIWVSNAFLELTLARDLHKCMRNERAGGGEESSPWEIMGVPILIMDVARFDKWEQFLTDSWDFSSVLQNFGLVSYSDLL